MNYNNFTTDILRGTIEERRVVCTTMKLYHVLHHEIMGVPDNLRADEMLFYTTSSLKKALEFIRTSGCDLWSWWEIQVSDLDEHEWPEHLGYWAVSRVYGKRGRKLRTPPYRRCERLYLQAKKDEFNQITHTEPQKGKQ